MDTASPPEFYRSEAFAEDLGLPMAEQPEPPAFRFRPWFNLLPLAVALAGVAFAVIPPLN